MDKIYSASMLIEDETIGEKLISCLYRDIHHLNDKISSEENTYIDIAKFLGIKGKTLSFKDMEILENMWDSRGISTKTNGYVYKDEDGYSLVIEGTNDCATGLLDYISRMTPEKVYEVEYWWDSKKNGEPNYRQGYIRNGIHFDDMRQIKRYDSYHKGMELAKQIEALYLKRTTEFKNEYKLNFGVYYTPRLLGLGVA